MVQSSIDIDRLLKLRLVVARFGEMDIAKWWNTKSQLGRLGTAALRRGFPRTHYFAQARSVFAVAAFRCAEVFDPPNSVTLWRLAAQLEEEFDARWEHWLDHTTEWRPFFQQLENLEDSNLLEALRKLDVITDLEIDSASRLRRSAEGRAVRAFSYIQGKKSDLGIAHDLDMSDLHVEAIDLLANHVEAEVGVAFFVACYSVMRKAPVNPALLILGDMSVQGNIKPLRPNRFKLPRTTAPSEPSSRSRISGTS